MQSLPAHPIDSTLDRMGIKRATFADLKGEAHKFAATLICRALSPGSDMRPLVVAIDVFLWKDGEVVRMELANVNMPPALKPMFEALIAQGLEGLPPRALGLTPCLHVPWHWDSLCLPLAWEGKVCNLSSLSRVVKRYGELLRDKSWQCPSVVQVTRYL